MWKLTLPGCLVFGFFCLPPQHSQFEKVETVPPELPQNDSFQQLPPAAPSAVFLVREHWHTMMGKKVAASAVNSLQAWLWSPTTGRSWLQQEENQPVWGEKSCVSQVISSGGITWHFVCTIWSSTEWARGHKHLWMELPPCYFPVPRVFGVWLADGSLQGWGSRRGTSWGSKPVSKPSANYWWTLHCYPAHTLIELLDACHNMHLLIAFCCSEGMKDLLACFGSGGHPFYPLIVGAVVSEFLRPITPSKLMLWLTLPRLALMGHGDEYTD